MTKKAYIWTTVIGLAMGTLLAVGNGSVRELAQAIETNGYVPPVNNGNLRVDRIGSHFGSGGAPVIWHLGKINDGDDVHTVLYIYEEDSGTAVHLSTKKRTKAK